MKTIYHVFETGFDEWVSPETALAFVGLSLTEEKPSFRVYSCEYNEEDDVYDDVDCIVSVGELPH